VCAGGIDATEAALMAAFRLVRAFLAGTRLFGERIEHLPIADRFDRKRYRDD
jgi:hypothetical protein